MCLLLLNLDYKWSTPFALLSRLLNFAFTVTAYRCELVGVSLGILSSVFDSFSDEIDESYEMKIFWRGNGLSKTESLLMSCLFRTS